MTSKQIPADLSARMSASIVLSRREMKSTRKSERGKGRRPTESREQKAERQGGECTVTGAGLIRCTLRQQTALHCRQATGNGKRTLRTHHWENQLGSQSLSFAANASGSMSTSLWPRRCKGGDGDKGDGRVGKMDWMELTAQSKLPL